MLVASAGAHAQHAHQSLQAADAYTVVASRRLRMIQDRAYHWHGMTNVHSPPHHASRHCITDARPDQGALPPHPSTVAIPARPSLQTDARGPTSARKSHPRPHSSESPQTKTTVSASPCIWRSPSRWCRHGQGTCQCRPTP